MGMLEFIWYGIEEGVIKLRGVAVLEWICCLNLRSYHLSVFPGKAQMILVTKAIKNVMVKSVPATLRSMAVADLYRLELVVEDTAMILGSLMSA